MGHGTNPFIRRWALRALRDRCAFDPHALPDLETFRVRDGFPRISGEDGECLSDGWYWWSCFPGCMPDSDPIGPFDTEDEALADAREGLED